MDASFYAFIGTALFMIGAVDQTIRSNQRFHHRMCILMHGQHDYRPIYLHKWFLGYICTRCRYHLRRNKL